MPGINRLRLCLSGEYNDYSVSWKQIYLTSSRTIRMLSKNRIKLIRSLARKKIRQSEGLFIAEGEKLLHEILNNLASGRKNYLLHSVIGTGDWIAENREALTGEPEIIEASPAELKQVSTQQAPNQALAIVKMPEKTNPVPYLKEGLSLGLSQLRDPGNLGTIIRTADWFGIRHIICSPDSVDLYNPKVIQSSMGSFLRVSVHYLDLEALLGEMKVDKNFRVYAGGMKGENLFESNPWSPSMILLGNESQGLPSALSSMADQTLSIPHHDVGSHAESLNVAMAAAVFCAEFRRLGV